MAFTYCYKSDKIMAIKIKTNKKNEITDIDINEKRQYKYGEREEQFKLSKVNIKRTIIIFLDKILYDSAQ